MEDDLPVYLNKSLGNLKGERWNDIPGFEGLYKVSNLGRVKSLDRVIPHPRLHSQFVKGCILCQSVKTNRNIKTGEPSVYLQVSLSQDGAQYFRNVRRLVYMAFIDSNIDFNKDGMNIINKDGNGYNNKLTNLLLSTMSDKSKRAFKRGRIDSFLKIADRSNWEKNYGGYVQMKPIRQYDLEGKLIAEYPSIRAASRATGIDDKSIIGVAKKRNKQCRGFIWEYF